MNEEFLNVMSSTAHYMLSQMKDLKDLKAMRGMMSLLLALCRNMEDIAPRNASKKAQARANELNLGDLRQYHFDNGSKFPGGRKSSLLHWEHWKPAADMRNELLSLGEATIQDVKSIISQTKICWILLEENKVLDLLGQRTKRRDPLEAYSLAKIELYYDW